MDEKLSIQDLSDALSRQCGITKDKSDDFVREFFELIKTSLEKDKYVRIKGLGVFKLIKVEPRESINIQAKERFEIPGYTKISFVPDISLKEAVNKPFSHFETVPLNENVVFEKMMENESRTDVSPSSPEKDFSLSILAESPKEKTINSSKIFQSRKPQVKLRINIWLTMLILLCVIALLYAMKFATPKETSPHIITLPQQDKRNMDSAFFIISPLQTDSISLQTSQTNIL